MSIPAASLQRILISRTDSIGDVVLTLPVAAMLRAHLPQAHIGFLCTPYTLPVIAACSMVDEAVPVQDFLDGTPARWDCIIHVFPRADIARQAKRMGIRYRIGTTNRAFHWLSCNYLVRLSRRRSGLHEAQLNIALLRPLGILTIPSPAELGAMHTLQNVLPLPDAWNALLQPGKFHLILHPKSSGSAREWGTERFLELIRLLSPERFQVFISGTAADRESLKPLLDAAEDRITDISGKMDLATFMAFINACDGLVARFYRAAAPGGGNG